MEKYDKLHDYSKRYIPYPWALKIGLKDLTPFKLRTIFLIYFIPFAAVAMNLTAVYLLSMVGLQTASYLMMIAVISAVAWFSRIRAAVAVVALSGPGSFLVVEIPKYVSAGGYFSGWQSFINPVIFIAAATLMVLIIDGAKKSREIEKLKKQESFYGEKFIELHADYAKAREEIKARDEFLSIASHELKTPLTTMLLKLNSMIHSIKNESLANFSVPALMKVLENAESQIKLLTTMINDLLNVSLITTGRMHLFRERIDLAEVARQVKENFSEVFREEKYAVKLFNRGSVIGFWDKGRIEQAMTNLVSNAIKYGRSRPIDIQVVSQGKVAKFQIKDRGVGIPRGEQKYLFHLFKRVENNGEKKKGLGVGLYITNQIAKAHGGAIKVKSVPQMGSVFTMELPLTKE